MTAIIGFPDYRRGRLLFMGDSAVCGLGDAGSVFTTATSKVQRAGAYVLGAAGDGYWFALLAAIRWPQVASAGYPENGGLRSDILKTKRELGFEDLKKDDALDGCMLLGAIVGGKPRLWVAEHTGMVDALPDGPFAIGSGGEACRAALAGMTKGTPELRSERALTIAASLRADVRGPFTKVWA